MDQIRTQTESRSAFGDAVTESLAGFDVKSSKGFQFMVDAFANRNPNAGVEDRLSRIEDKLVNVVPEKIGAVFADELDKATAIAGLPNQAKR